ncbi:MAG: glycosyltransferase family 4 protein [Chthoniobacteraceae bacterium]|nr:glycosyltransferase family 4 protein [Chthoniobacteraceae bacterium]
MKILFLHGLPFSLAHGGVQTQIEQTKAGLEQVGVEVEYLRWWDERQTGDIIQVFGRPGTYFVELAHQKKIRVVLSDLLTGQGSRAAWKRQLQRWVFRGIEAVCPPVFSTNLSSRSYRAVDACFALTPWEARLMETLYGADAGKIHVVPNGVEEAFLREPARPRGKWLVCTATITERKRVLELSRAALLAKTPLWIIGKPYAESDSYFAEFRKMAMAHPDLIRYEGPVSDRGILAGIYREARGFVLLSAMESLSLSALEAAACESPLLLSDLPWARASFGPGASYCSLAGDAATARCLSRFYEAAPSLPLPAKPLTWVQVAREMKGIYEALLSASW